MIRRLRDKSFFGELAAGSVAVIVPALYYLLELRRLFPLIEFRSWLDDPGLGWLKLLQVMAFRHEMFSRWVSLSFVKSMKGMCGIDVECLNTLSYLPVGLACVLLYLLARQLGLPRLVASGVTLAWAFSAPVADAMSWQATSHDRLASLFSFAALNVACHQLGKPWSWRRFAVSNGALLLLLMLAYNSKESSFFLGPALVLLALARSRPWDRRSVVRALSLVVAPTAYAVFHNVRYARLLALDPLWQAHTRSGHPAHNMKMLAPFLLGQDGWSMPTILAFVLLALVTVVSFVRGTTRLWLWLAFLIAASAALRTRVTATYYLMLPVALFYLACALELAAVARMLPRRLQWAYAIVLGAVCSMTLLPGFVDSHATLKAESEHSDAFQASLPLLRRYIPQTHAGRVYLVTDDARPDAYRFVGERNMRDLYPYVYRSLLTDRRFELQFFDLKTSAWRRLEARDDSALYVVFDETMRLQRIDAGARTLYQGN